MERISGFARSVRRAGIPAKLPAETSRPPQKRRLRLVVHAVPLAVPAKACGALVLNNAKDSVTYQAPSMMAPGHAARYAAFIPV